MQTTYGSTDPNDPNYDPHLADLAQRFQGKPVSLQAALTQHALGKILASRDNRDEDLDQLLSAPALAGRYGVDPERLRKRLEHWRKQRDNAIGGDWTEVDSRAANTPKYLYRLRAVLPLVQALKGDG